MIANGPAIILVQPQMGENIGAAARAMFNCGLTDLRLVAPRDGWPNDAARRNASGADGVIDNATLYPTLRDAIADRSFVIACTARLRDMVKPVLDPMQAATAIRRADKAAASNVSAFVFGPERSGLVNEDIVQCDAILNIPLNPAYSSLNVAQAVLLAAYHWHAHEDVRSGEMDMLGLDRDGIADKEQVATLLDHLTAALEDGGYFPTAQHKPAAMQNLSNMIQRMRLTAIEAQSLHGMIKALRRSGIKSGQ